MSELSALITLHYAKLSFTIVTPIFPYRKIIIYIVLFKS